MPLSIPSRKGISDALRSSLRNTLPELDPSTERRSFIGALVKALASSVYDWYVAFKRYADREPFPQTASRSFLTKGWWVELTKLQKNPAAPAHGKVAIEGSQGVVIAAGTELTNGQVSYEVQASAIVTAIQLTANTLTVDAEAGVCIFESVADQHFLATGMTVLISGATPSTYNGSVVITVTAENEFTYEPDTLPGVAATGAPKATATAAIVEIEATTSGQATNVDAATVMSITSAPIGADSFARVSFGGIAGGSDAETDDEYRARILEALGTDYGMFTEDEIKIVAKTVPGVTRVMVRTASVGAPSGWPNEGQVKIAFLRENDANPLPSAQEVADVKAKIVALLMPSHTDEEDVIVMSPPPYAVDFTFSALAPDTAGMRVAIRNVLTQFFLESVEWGVAITADEYRCAILTAYDPETRQKLRSFTLSTPSGTVTPGVDDMPVLGTVTFP